MFFSTAAKSKAFANGHGQRVRSKCSESTASSMRRLLCTAVGLLAVMPALSAELAVTAGHRSLRERMLGGSDDFCGAFCDEYCFALDAEDDVCTDGVDAQQCGVACRSSCSGVVDPCAAKKLRIESSTGAQIQLFEVQAFSMGIDILAGNGGTAHQSATYKNLERFSASKAIDGNKKSFSHTTGENPFLEIEFHDTRVIDKVVLFNRYCKNPKDPAGCLCKLSSAALTLLDEDDNVVSTKVVGDTCNTRVLQEEMTCSSLMSATSSPSDASSATPSATSSMVPSASPSMIPSVTSSMVPSFSPSIASSAAPSITSSDTPSMIPSVTSSMVPSTSPSIASSVAPSITSSDTPSMIPSVTPSLIPSNAPSIQLAKYVKLQLFGENRVLMIREVYVFDVGGWANYAASAQGGVATQSSTYKWSGVTPCPASIANDINWDYKDIEGLDCEGVSHTEVEKDPWWQVELAQGFAVKTVQIKSRMTCCLDSLNGLKVSLLDKDQNEIDSYTFDSINEWAEYNFVTGGNHYGG